VSLDETRETLQRVAVHILARRRSEVTGRFGLRPSPGGVATPAFGDGPEVVRTSGEALVHEVGGTATLHLITGASLRQLAEVVGVDLDAQFSCGEDTPPLGDPDQPLALGDGQVNVLASWWSLGAEVLDRVAARLGPDAAPATTQLWPEHFDVATTVRVAGGARANLGFSPGDGHLDEPYCYLGPWGDDRPGDDGYWNAPFGAVCPRRRAGTGAGQGDACAEFLFAGLARLGTG
jgi:hypothetical protein